MKKTTLLCTLVTIVAFSAGWFTNQKVNTDSIESARFKMDLIVAQDAAIEQSKKVMWNNDLFDEDGSDDMAEYLDLCCEVDSMYRTQL